MADNDDRNVPQEGMCITKETLEGMMKQMEGRIFTALSEHLKVTSADAAVSSKSMDRGKMICIENSQDEFCDSEAQLEDRGMLPHLGHKSLVRVPVTSQRQASPLRSSTWIFSEHLSESVFTEEQIWQWVQEEVQEAQTGTKKYLGFSSSDGSPRVQEGAEKGPQVSQVTKVPRDRRNNLKTKENPVNVSSTTVNSGPRYLDVASKVPFNHPRHPPIPTSQNYRSPSAPHQQSYLPTQTFPRYRPQAPVHPQTESRDTSPQCAYQNNPIMQQARPRVPSDTFDVIPISYMQLYQQLLTEGRIAPTAANPNPNLTSPYCNPNATCAFHSGQVGHDFENCRHLKQRIQDMIKAGQLNFTSKPNVNANLLPSRDAPIVGTRGFQSPQCIDVAFRQGNEVKKGDDIVNVWSAPANLRPPAQNSSCYPAPLALSQSNLRQPTPQHVEPVRINTHYHHVPSYFALHRNPTSPLYQSSVSVAQHRRDRRFRHFDTFPISYAELFRQLAAQEVIIHVIPKQVSNPPPRSYNPNLHCFYHSNAPGHDTENCTALKNLIQDLYEDGRIEFDETPVQPRRPNVPRIPPNHHVRR